MKDNTLKPILLHTKDLKVLIIGFGRIGKRKAKAYARVGADITIVDPNSPSELQHDAPINATYYPLSFHTFISHHIDIFLKQHLVVICTPSNEVNQAVEQLCKVHAKLYNRTDNAKASQYSDMMYDQGKHHLIAVSGNASSPYVSKYLLSIIKETLATFAIKKRISILFKQSTYLKQHQIPYEKISHLEDEALENLSFLEDEQ
jgi:precorrin-2 dehydrogenase/sirohydrochlorin ferrochelatase